MPKTTKPEEQKRWRENIEALTVAVMVALLFKYFVLEISKIPSGSMQPTLMGHAGTGVFDRVLVDKFSFCFRDPDRYEIVVFKHPLERSRVMVKRLVGMPDEQLKIEHGDLWTRASESDEWQVLRPPGSVQSELWKRIDVNEPQQSSWSSSEGSVWVAKRREARTNDPGYITFRARDNGVRNEYTHGYPDSLRKEIDAERRRTSGLQGRGFVGDLRVEGDVEPAAAVTAFTVLLQEGPRLYEFRIPGPASDASSKAEIRYHVRNGSSDVMDRIEIAESGRLAKAKSYSFSAQNLNDRLTLELDGDVLAEIDIPANENQHTVLQLGFEGGGGELQDLQVYRDTFYSAPLPNGAPWIVTIPAENYVMLGDNTLDSADSRLWEEQTITLAGLGPRSGNYRNRENPLPGVGDYRNLVRFKDTYGEVDWFPRETIESESGLRLEGLLSELGAIEREPLVSRNLILGRAVAIFWPIRPTERLWRLAWLH